MDSSIMPCIDCISFAICNSKITSVSYEVATREIVEIASTKCEDLFSFITKTTYSQINDKLYSRKSNYKISLIKSFFKEESNDRRTASMYWLYYTAYM